MRSATNNRFIGAWVYYPDNEGACDRSHQLWSWAEITTQQMLGARPGGSYTPANGLSRGEVGSYQWPSSPEFGALGPSKSNADTGSPAYQSKVLVTVEPEGSCSKPTVSLCIGPASGGGCPAQNWGYKYGIQWERSLDGGESWFRFPAAALNLTSNRITIGSESASFNDDAVRTNERLRKGQFYGIIDSVRISRGKARYTAKVCQPYNPKDDEATLIDDSVVFALNLGNDVNRYPGSTKIRYYVKARGWLVPTDDGSVASMRKIYNNNQQTRADFEPDSLNLPGMLRATIVRPGVTINKVVDLYAAHQLLSYSNRSAGYRNRCGIQFPVFNSTYSGQEISAAEFYQALILDDFMLPLDPAYSRVLEVNYATIENLTTDYAGRIIGNKRSVDGQELNLTSGAKTYTVLVKTQDTPTQNGIYKTAKSFPNDLRPWTRVISADNPPAVENYDNLTIRITAGPTNIGTQWRSITSTPIFGETDIQFEREEMLGTFKDDFCVEAYFKVPSFLHPVVKSSATSTGYYSTGENMTLIDTYYREERDSGPAGVRSGLRIYLNPAIDNPTSYVEDPENSGRTPSPDAGKTGRAYVDIGRYVISGFGAGDAVPAKTDPAQGPALRSSILQTDRFYHIAVTREKDTFRLYVDGILQDTIILQEKIFTPETLVKEDNDILYRGRAYMGANFSKPTHNHARILLRDSEFFFNAQDFTPAYAKRFNGAAGMINSDSGLADPDFFNVSPTIPTLGIWPGAPIPDYPASSHIYLYNDVTRDLDDVSGSGAVQRACTFVVQPSIRFPPDTINVDLASVPEDTKYVNNSDASVTVPGSGNITLSGLYGNGRAAFGLARFTFSALAAVTIGHDRIFTANGIDFKINPADSTKSYRIVTSSAGVQYPATDLVPTLLPNGKYFVLIPLIATTNAAAGNLNTNDPLTFPTSPTITNLFSVTANSAFFGGLDDGSDPRKVDGIIVTAGMRILVKDQDDAKANGIYVASAGAWPRAVDFSTDDQLIPDQRVFVNTGFTNCTQAFTLDLRAVPLNQVPKFGVTDIIFNEANDTSSAGTNFQVAAQKSTMAGTGLTVASETAILVSCITTQNITLYGIYGGTTPVGSGGAAVLPAFDNTLVSKIGTAGGLLVFVKAQSNPAENGIYITSSGAWRRAASFDSTGELTAANGKLVAPQLGDSADFPYGYRMYFSGTLGVSAVTSGTATVLTQLYTPTNWSNVDIKLTTDINDGLTKTNSGQSITWTDFLNSGSHRTVWRLRFQCGKTIVYSRNMILYSAKRAGITTAAAFGSR